MLLQLFHRRLLRCAKDRSYQDYPGRRDRALMPVRWLRLFAQRQGIGGRLLTRSGYDWSERYPAVLKAVMALKINSCLIDGEVAICDERGVAAFDWLLYGPRVKPEAVLFAFDLLCIARMRPQRHHPAR